MDVDGGIAVDLRDNRLVGKFDRVLPCPSTMSTRNLRRTHSATTPNEYVLLMNVHAHLSGRGPLENERKRLNSRKRLALVTGVAPKVAQEAIRLYNAGETPREKKVGRPKETVDPMMASIIRELVINANKTGVPMYSKMLVAELAKLGHVVTVRTLHRNLKALGFHYGKGNRRNLLHDSQGTIDYRNVYLEKRLNNLQRNGLPIAAEVFLDESYCHLDHHARFTWVPAKGVVNERGRKPMLVIFGAFVVFCQDSQLEAKLVRESVLIWPVKGQQRGISRRGRAAADDELWRTVPDFVRECQIAPDFHDYHGNFTADLFERLFTNLCCTLREDYGVCHIHMDGAKYHVRKVDPQPTTSTRLTDIRAWLERKDAAVPLQENGAALTKLKLLEFVKTLKIPPVYASYEIAQTHGHVIMKTPPYHCELQPIEQVWGIVKNKIAAAPNIDETELSLRNRLLELFAAITPKQLQGAWKKMIINCQDYWQIFTQELEKGVTSDGVHGSGSDSSSASCDSTGE